MVGSDFKIKLAIAGKDNAQACGRTKVITFIKRIVRFYEGCKVIDKLRFLSEAFKDKKCQDAQRISTGEIFALAIF